MDRKHLSYFVVFFLFGCASGPIQEQLPEGLIITEVKPNKWTALTKQNIIHLTQVYDLKPFIYSPVIKIFPNDISHRSPVITINIRFAQQPEKILSVFLHEQFHWLIAQNSTKEKSAIEELKKLYPKVPIYRNGLEATYNHLLVCYLENRALEYYLGKAEATRVHTEMMEQDKLYSWIYGQILTSNISIKKIIEKYDLLPEVLKTDKKPTIL
ncbi:MAG TPA: hypothetical protein VNJ08_00495 [Bacteriovoracaceae bacterium]|nr:hypothetical protein [Bacteriovoracaceae bacterium]